MDAAEPLRLLSGSDDAPADPNLRSMWHITLTVAGHSVPEPEIKAARLKARDEIVASLKAAEAEDAF